MNLPTQRKGYVSEKAMTSQPSRLGSTMDCSSSRRPSASTIMPPSSAPTGFEITPKLAAINENHIVIQSLTKKIKVNDNKGQIVRTRYTE